MLDSKAVVEEVEKYRQDWKPSKTKVVLLAESHAHTTQAQFNRLLKKDFHHRDGTRCRYVNFVYCIGNSESYALEKETSIRSSTTQYWRILYSCLNPIRGNRDFYLFVSGSSRDRINHKRKLLNDLKKARIRLVDASIIGINVLDIEARRDVIRKCWNSRLASMLKRLRIAGLRSVITVGSPVSDELQSDLEEMKLEVKTIPQPQAHVIGGYLSYYKLIHQTCQKYRT